MGTGCAAARAEQVVTDVHPEPLTRAQATRRFRGLLESGAELCPAGDARDDPACLLSRAYLPRSCVRLFDATFYLGDYRYNDALGFIVGYVVLDEERGPPRTLVPRLFYKDSSLLWRVATHYIHDHNAFWIGKGDTRDVVLDDGSEAVSSVEETANIPFEVQAAFDEVSRGAPRRWDEEAIELVVRQAPSYRVEPYADFVAPRRAAAACHAIHGGRPIARFTRRGDPGSLRFARGYEPDFDRGFLEESRAKSSFFGGVVRKCRILSTNRRVQYLFFASPTHAWLNPPQALTTQLSSYGVRTIDVLAADDAFLPAFEYHEEGDTQIPEGYAGEPHPEDPHRADASAWIEALPVIQAFRKKIAGPRRRH